MKVSLANGKANCRAYGLSFDLEGIAESKPEIVQSLLDTGALIAVKPVKAPAKPAT